MKKLLLAIVLIVGCDEVITHKHKHGCIDSQATNYDPTADIDNNSCEYDMFCQVRFQYWDSTGDITNYYRCIENISEEMCIYKATYGCAEWIYGLAYGDAETCASDLVAYGQWNPDSQGFKSCSEYCDSKSSLVHSYCAPW